MVAGTQHKSVVDTKNKKIDQIGIVVKDAHKTAVRYTELFGIGPWVFLDIAPIDMVFQNNSIEDGSSIIRVALTNLGQVQIELIQPLSGEGTHATFLKERGEGVHHLSFGMVDDYDRIMSGFTDNGYEIEMSGSVGAGAGFVYMDTKNDLGTLFEFVKKPGIHSGELLIKPWGAYESKDPGLINIEGKEIKQIGIVVEDAEKAARIYWDLFGLGPWMFVDFKPPNISDVKLHNINMIDGADFHVRAALADFGNMQIELLEPVKGPSTYMEFLKTYGQGVHHVSFGESKDHNELVSAMQNQGFEIEMTGVLGNALRFTYMETQKDLGTIFEVIHTDPEIEITLLPYGTYPPS
jgi:catechol 2,3-dioxygenase-like lactoylglutathione lyase family enzyme